MIPAFKFVHYQKQSLQASICYNSKQNFEPKEPKSTTSKPQFKLSETLAVTLAAQ